MKHAFWMPQLLHDPGLASAMRTAQLYFFQYGGEERIVASATLLTYPRRSRCENLTTSAVT
eukprot:6205994-Pleurochrysis_carterae.AAC.1